MKDDIIVNKTQTIVRCILRVKEEYTAASENFFNDFSRQDSVVLNLQRAAQTAIDLAAHIVRVQGLNAPKETKDLFVTLHQNKIISEQSSSRMIKMVGFRNIAIHEYRKLDLNQVVSIVTKNLTDFEQFMQEILAAH